MFAVDRLSLEVEITVPACFVHLDWFPFELWHSVFFCRVSLHLCFCLLFLYSHSHLLQYPLASIKHSYWPLRPLLHLIHHQLSSASTSNLMFLTQHTMESLYTQGHYSSRAVPDSWSWVSSTSNLHPTSNRATFFPQMRDALLHQLNVYSISSKTQDVHEQTHVAKARLLAPGNARVTDILTR